MPIETPDQRYQALFYAAQASRIFSDSKQFVDAVPKFPANRILQNYLENSHCADFDLRTFVSEHFCFPRSEPASANSHQRQPVEVYIEQLWDKLSRQPDAGAANSSLIPLPHPYIVPGGRFQEIYYWDSYFTILGLAVSGRTTAIKHMLDNFAWLIDTIGFIPNGNRSYFCSRSQPPFFALMVELLAAQTNASMLADYLPQLTREYQFWMAGSEQLQTVGDARQRVIKSQYGFLNRYWDNSDQPRQESYLEDIQLAACSDRDASYRDNGELYRDIRAACESGWDFSSRWLEQPTDLASIRTTQIIPVDLNALLYKLESVLADANRIAGKRRQAVFFAERAEQRKSAIQQLFFNEATGLFNDLLLPDFAYSNRASLAAAFPLFLEIATPHQGGRVAEALNALFLRPGGWVTTLDNSGQQWDSPNGWAPLQWVVYRGMKNYGFDHQAEQGARRWIDNNLQVYQSSGALVEKYNVVTPGIAGGGGEYIVQEGFGWTNGVLLKLLSELAGFG